MPLEQKIQESLDAGDLKAAATKILTDYGPRVHGYLVSVLRDEGTAREVFRQFCGNLWRGLPGLGRQFSARTWAFKMAWSAVVDHRARAARQVTKHPSQTTRNCSSTRRWNLGLDRLSRLRRSLDPQEQSLLILRINQRMSWAEVAEVMSEGSGPDETALRDRFQRLKEKLCTLAHEAGLMDG